MSGRVPVGHSERFRTSRRASDFNAEMPFYDCLEDALKSLVQRLGGAKAVGAALFPEKSPDSAARALLDCLNPERAEKLSAGQILLVLRMGHEAGIHDAKRYIDAETGYETVPVTRAEQEDRLVSVIDSASKTMRDAMQALARLKGAER